MTDATKLCWHQSEPCDQGVFRCTKPEGHDGPHQSAQAHWWSDPPSAAKMICDWCVIRGRVVRECMKCGGTGRV